MVDTWGTQVSLGIKKKHACNTSGDNMYLNEDCMFSVINVRFNVDMHITNNVDSSYLCIDFVIKVFPISPSQVQVHH